MNWLRGITRFFLVSAGIILLTSIGIDATQYFEGSGSALSILTREALQDSCPEHMVEVSTKDGQVCVDSYEASAGTACKYSDPRNIDARWVYGSASDAGVFSIHADIVPSSTGTAIGFRCAVSL